MRVLGKEIIIAEFMFDNGKISKLSVSEEVLINQMNRPKHKRLYVCGIEFSRVESVKVVEE